MTDKISIPQAEAEMRKNSAFLDDIIKDSVSKDVNLKEIIRNPNNEDKTNIYNLSLDDGSKIVLKLTDDEKIQNEINGMKYAASAGVQHPKLIYADKSSDNPFDKAFLLMEYKELQSFEDVFAGDQEVEYCGNSFLANPSAVEQHVMDCLPILKKLHKKTGCINKLYQPDEMQKIFKMYNGLIDTTAKEEDKEQFLDLVGKIFEFYSKNKEAFIDSPEYHLHGDLRPHNLAHTDEGVALIDWEYYQQGDAAVDVAYFNEKNLIIPELRQKQEDMINNIYLQNDDSFEIRLKFHTALTKLRECIPGYGSKDELADYVAQYF